MRKIIVVLLSFVEIAILFSGCIPSKPTEDIEILPSERLINKLEANRRKIRNFEGVGTITIKSSKFNNSASFRIVLEKPDSIYLSIMGPFGIELAQALVTKDNFVFYDALQNTAYEGAADEQVLRQIFKIDLSFSDLMDAFIGSVNLTSHLYKDPTKYDIDYDKYVLTYVDSSSMKTTQYKVDIRQLGITDYKILNPSDDLVLEGKYSKFDLLENVAVPYKIQILNHKENQQLFIDYKTMAANKRNINIDFHLPSDATVIKW